MSCPLFLCVLFASLEIKIAESSKHTLTPFPAHGMEQLSLHSQGLKKPAGLLQKRIPCRSFFSSTFAANARKTMWQQICLEVQLMSWAVGIAADGKWNLPLSL